MNSKYKTLRDNIEIGTKEEEGGGEEDSTAVRGVAGAHVLWSSSSGGCPFYKDGDSWVASWESPTFQTAQLFKNGVESFQRGLRSLGESFKNP